MEPNLEARWDALAAPVRDYVTAFLTGATDHGTSATPKRVVPLDATIVSSSYADDLLRGGPALRAALPDLARTVTGIRGTNPLVVRVRCRGHHGGTFFDMILPSRKAVEFDEVHHLRFEADAPIEDVIAIDMARILRQLVVR